MSQSIFLPGFHRPGKREARLPLIANSLIPSAGMKAVACHIAKSDSAGFIKQHYIDISCRFNGAAGSCEMTFAWISLFIPEMPMVRKQSADGGVGIKQTKSAIKTVIVIGVP